MTDNINDHLVLICGESTTGKSASLMNLKDQANYIYLNTESGKRLPFKTDMNQLTITDPYVIYDVFTQAETEEGEDCKGIIIDSLTYMMDQYESMYVLPAEDTRAAWQDFAQFFKKLMQQYVAASSKSVIFTAHTTSLLDKKEHISKTFVPVKGSLKNNGIESYFSVIIGTKKMRVEDLESYESDLLNITDEEEALGYKYVFQTKLTKDTVHENMRGPLGLWKSNETFIDNDVQVVLDRLNEYYS